MLENHIRAADSAGVPVLVRVTANQPVQILHALDAGAAGVIVPHVDTAEQAAAAVRAAHYPRTAAADSPCPRGPDGTAPPAPTSTCAPPNGPW
ncbi:aldolase/citrate lyase family protein [Actinomadura madurae]|uniref:aldolase/citrate lyase family protein n=1 Tax=Actinomadura madurae TaxID=1993 RepID=UPI003555C37F